jgi:hypothetical protein
MSMLRLPPYKFAGGAALGGVGFDPASLFTTHSADGLYVPTFGDFSKLYQTDDISTPVTAVGQAIGKVVDSGPTGTTMLQATAGSRGSLQQVASGHYVWRGDGVATHLLTNLFPGAAMTLIVGIMFNADTDSAMGAREAATTTRVAMGTSYGANAGKLSGTVGTQEQATITGGSDVRGTAGVGALRYNGTNVQLWWRPGGGALTTLYGPSAQSGTVQTTVPFTLGATNNNGTVNIPISGDIYSAFVIKAALTDAQVAQVVGVLAI